MIKSKFSILGWGTLFIETFFLIIITVLAADNISGYFFSYNILHKTGTGQYQFFLLLFVVATFILFFLRFLTILKLIKIVSIDINNKTLTLKNILTRQVKIFSLKDFDGYYDAIKRAQYGSHKEILIIKNDKVITIISDKYNSNYKELLDSLSDITFLGTLNYNFQDKIGMLFNNEIV